MPQPSSKKLSGPEALRAHPDCGGQAADFVRLRQAYDQIIGEIARRPPGVAAEPAEEPVDTQRFWPRPFPDWEPDLIVLDEPLSRVRPPRPPDPSWEPELIVRDEPLPRIRPARPPDPNWEPELVLLDDEAGHGRRRGSPDPRSLRQNYIGWIRRVAKRSRDDDNDASRSTGDKLFDIVAFLLAIILPLVLYWAFSGPKPRTIASELSEPYFPKLPDDPAARWQRPLRH